MRFVFEGFRFFWGLKFILGVEVFTERGLRFFRELIFFKRIEIFFGAVGVYSWGTTFCHGSSDYFRGADDFHGD